MDLEGLELKVSGREWGGSGAVESRYWVGTGYAVSPVRLAFFAPVLIGGKCLGFE